MFRWADPKPEEVKPPPPDPREPMLKWFAYNHLPEHLQPTSAKFAELAMWMRENLPAGPEATEAMRNLLTAKDCAVRASIDHL